MRTLSFVTVALAACAVAACSSDAPTSTGIDADGQANLSVIFNDLSAISTASATATGTASNDAILPSACSYSGASESFVCPARVRRVGDDVFHVQSSFMLLDANGDNQSSFDIGTTSAVRVVVTSHDTLTLPPSGNYEGGSYSIERTDDHTVSGLLSATREVNGVGAATSSLLGLSEHDTATAVILPAAGSTNVLPTSGTIVIRGSSSELGANSITTLTFVGGNAFTITNTAGDTKTCSMDPITRAVTCS
jgi:hypothetical protein